jgi:hypothetical protein
MWFQTLQQDADRPLIDFKDGILLLYGKCIPQNANESLDELFDEMLNYLNTGLDLTILFKFDAVNTTSSKKFGELIVELNKIRESDCEKKSNRKINIIWSSPKIDEDMQELGEYYRDCSDGQAQKFGFKKIVFKLKTYNYDN